MPPESTFHFDLHLFLLKREVFRGLVIAMAQLAFEGLGPGRGSVILQSVSTLDFESEVTGWLYRNQAFTGEWPAGLQIDLSSRLEAHPRIVVQFITPTELKGVIDPARPEFGTLIARLRDRISALRSFYGEGPLEIDFRGLADRARTVRIESADMHPIRIQRRSSRTGQVHGIGGWTGRVEYVGELREFIPYLQAGQWTGVGRQTVWGNGELRVGIDPLPL